MTLSLGCSPHKSFERRQGKPFGVGRRLIARQILALCLEPHLVGVMFALTEWISIPECLDPIPERSVGGQRGVNFVDRAPSTIEPRTLFNAAHSLRILRVELLAWVGEDGLENSYGSGTGYDGAETVGPKPGLNVAIFALFIATPDEMAVVYLLEQDNDVVVSTPPWGVVSDFPDRVDTLADRYIGSGDFRPERSNLFSSGNAFQLHADVPGYVVLVGRGHAIAPTIRNPSNNMLATAIEIVRSKDQPRAAP